MLYVQRRTTRTTLACDGRYPISPRGATQLPSPCPRNRMCVACVIGSVIFAICACRSCRVSSGVFAGQFLIAVFLCCCASSVRLVGRVCAWTTLREQAMQRNPSSPNESDVLAWSAGKRLKLDDLLKVELIEIQCDLVFDRCMMIRYPHVRTGGRSGQPFTYA